MHASVVCLCVALSHNDPCALYLGIELILFLFFVMTVVFRSTWTSNNRLSELSDDIRLRRSDIAGPRQHAGRAAGKYRRTLGTLAISLWLCVCACVRVCVARGDVISSHCCAQALETLTLSMNDLTTVPFALGRLTTLQTLRLAHNSLTALPLSFAALTALSDLDLSGNPLTVPPIRVVRCPFPASSCVLAHSVYLRVCVLVSVCL